MYIKKSNNINIYLVHLYIFIFVGLFGIITTPIKEIILGIKDIILNGSLLITDYMFVGGMGATLVNSSITSLLILFLYKINKAKPTGSMIVSLWLTMGFSMVGKNFINIWPPIFGVYLYVKIQKEDFSNYILIATLSSALAPLSTEIFNTLSLNIYLTFIIALISSILLGIVLSPIAKFCLKIHQGYNLYNVGFANGLLSILLISIFKYFGIEFRTNFLWSTIYKTPLTIFLIILFVILIILGINKNCFLTLKNFSKYSGRTITDFYLMYKNTTFLNMGILGLTFLFYILIVGGDLNGAVIATLFGVVGFGALGKHLSNVIPISLGVIIVAILKNTPLNNPSLLIATLGSTGLAPIAGQFGKLAGIISGAVHLILINNIGQISNGINLYNNGFIAGIVALIIIPIIDSFKKGD